MIAQAKTNREIIQIIGKEAWIEKNGQGAITAMGIGEKTFGLEQDIIFTAENNRTVPKGTKGKVTQIQLLATGEFRTLLVVVHFPTLKSYQIVACRPRDIDVCQDA